jgi:GTP-sensing pleiotropic transcriptional regulator CodY
MVKMFKGLISEMQLSRNAYTDVFNQLKTIQENISLQAIDQFNPCLDLAVETGADKDLDQYFVATKLFKDEYNRAIFNRFDTAAQRMKWLQRFCKEYFG